MPLALPALTTLVALLLYFVIVVNVGRARMKYKIAAPAVTGHPDFERAYRVQMNTHGATGRVPAGALAVRALREPVAGRRCSARVWVAGRALYAVGYYRAAEKRGAGFGIGMLAFVALVAGRRMGRGARRCSRVDGRGYGARAGSRYNCAFHPRSSCHADERAHRSLAPRHGRTRAARPDPRRHRGLQRRPESAQGQPRRRRLLRRQRQGAAARVREARRARDDRQGVAALATCRSTAFPPTTARCSALLFGADARRDRSRPRGDRAGAGRHRRAQGRRRFPAPLRAGRAGLDQRSRAGRTTARCSRAPGFTVNTYPVLRRDDARPRLRRHARGARSAARGLDRRAARVLPQPDRRRSDAGAVGRDHRDRPRARTRAVPRPRLPGLRRRHRRRRRRRAPVRRDARARCSSRARSRSRSRSTASASARCRWSPPTRTKPRACCRS